MVTFFLTNKCNAKCSFCIIKDELNKPTNDLNEHELSYLAKKLPTLQLLILTGGEPFLSPTLVHLINELDRYKKVQNISIPSNGTYPEKLQECLEKIQLKNIKSLTLSLSIDEEFTLHEQVRHLPVSRDKILTFAKTIRHFQHKFKGKLIFHVASVYSAKNQERIEEIIAWIKKELGPDSMGLTLVRAPAPDEYFKNIDYNKYIRINSLLSNQSASRNFLFFGHRLHAEKSRRVALESQGHFISKCFAGSMNLIIWPNGEVSICEKIKSATGNLKDYDFNLKKLCQSKLHQEAITDQRVKNCACGHECHVTPNILYNPVQLFRLFLTKR